MGLTNETSHTFQKKKKTHFITNINKRQNKIQVQKQGNISG